ncbi:hypothetical protein KKB06_01280, partial [Patescibacteria group bacterium]|nr:hypothetical protein [Patescibacteria group bacterium]
MTFINLLKKKLFTFLIVFSISLLSPKLIYADTFNIAPGDVNEFISSIILSNNNGDSNIINLAT